MWKKKAVPNPDDEGYIKDFYKTLDDLIASPPSPAPSTTRTTSTSTTSIYQHTQQQIAATWTGKANRIRAFLEQHAQPPPSPSAPPQFNDDPTPSFSRLPRVAIVTSGSVPTPLDTDVVNYLDTLGSGNRAAACAEAYLRAGYLVIFLYRDGSLRPFSRLLAKRYRKADGLTEQIQVNETTGKVELVLESHETEVLRDVLAAYTAVRPRLLEVTFTELFEYLYLLREASRAVAPWGHGALLFLAAGLTKMFIPRPDLPPPSSAVLDKGHDALKLLPVPHVIKFARKSWCPQAYLVAFKLANDSVSLTESAHKQLERHGLHMIVGNTVKDRGRRVLLVTERDETNLVSPHKEQELEPNMVRAVVRNHREFTLEREALKSSKKLLGISAKFTMFRENKSVVEEDAYGNKNVPFKVGLRIKGNRRAVDSPIYELKSVFSNKDHSARCHIWQLVGNAVEGSSNSNSRSTTSTPLSTPTTAATHKSGGAGAGAGGGGGGGGEILVTFSPAGNPETILNLLDDTYKGWLEDEIKRIVDAAKYIPISTYIRMLMAPITADFTDATELLNRFLSSVSTAWKEREKTSFAQAMGNLMALGFDRGLSELGGVMDVYELLDRRRLEEVSGSSSSFSILQAAAAGAGVGVGTPVSSGVTEGDLREIKVHKPVFRGQSLGALLKQKQEEEEAEEEVEEEEEEKEDGRQEQQQQSSHPHLPTHLPQLRSKRLSTSAATMHSTASTSRKDDDDEEELARKATTPRVHKTVKRYAEEMLEGGVLEQLLSYVKADPSCRVIVTGYSLGGMLSQIFCLKLGEALLQNGLSTRNVSMMAFGSPRVGDEGFKARLALLYPNQSRLMNVIYPLDTVHAFPPTNEGYVDAVVKVFLKQPGQFVGRRTPAKNNYTLTWLRVMDIKIDEIAARRRGASPVPVPGSGGGGGGGRDSGSNSTIDKEEEEKQTEGKEKDNKDKSKSKKVDVVTCDLCGLNTHTTQRHRCRICTERGSHRHTECPHKDEGCRLCGLPTHVTGEHRCSVCKLPGHRGRYCHELASVGWAELASFSMFHDSYYYSLATANEDLSSSSTADEGAPRLAGQPTSPPPTSPKQEEEEENKEKGDSSSVRHRFLGMTFTDEDLNDLNHL